MATEECCESDWVGWPMSGPRTCLWCLQYLAETDGHPTAHHTRWRHQAGLTVNDPGVSVHETVMKAVTFGLCFDQLNISESAAFELLMRQAQLVEMKYKHRSLKGIAGDPGHEEEYLVLGTSTTRGQLMINPDLEAFVAAEMGKEGALLKERRRLAEERRLAKGDGEGKKPKKGEDGGE